MTKKRTADHEEITPALTNETIDQSTIKYVYKSNEAKNERLGKYLLVSTKYKLFCNKDEIEEQSTYYYRIFIFIISIIHLFSKLTFLIYQSLVLVFGSKKENPFDTMDYKLAFWINLLFVPLLLFLIALLKRLRKIPMFVSSLLMLGMFAFSIYVDFFHRSGTDLTFAEKTNEELETAMNLN